MTSHGAACGVQGPCQRQGKGRILPVVISVSTVVQSPCGVALSQAVASCGRASCVLSVGCLAWLPRVVPVGPYKRAGVLWCAIRRVGFSSHQVVLSVEMGAPSPWVCCIDVSCQRWRGPSEPRHTLMHPSLTRCLTCGISLPHAAQAIAARPVTTCAR